MPNFRLLDLIIMAAIYIYHLKNQKHVEIGIKRSTWSRWILYLYFCLIYGKNDVSLLICLIINKVYFRFIFKFLISVFHHGSFDTYIQGTNVRKVISEVYAFFVLLCTVFGRKSKHKTDVTAWHEIHFHKKNQWNILVIRNYYVNY